jgi:hypothetical protein
MFCAFRLHLLHVFLLFQTCFMKSMFYQHLWNLLVITPTTTVDVHSLFAHAGVQSVYFVLKSHQHLDFHIFDILNFDLLIGYPIENLPHTPLGNLYEKLRKMTSATPCLENPLGKLFPKQNPLEEMMRLSSYVSFEPILFEVVEFATPNE